MIDLSSIWLGTAVLKYWQTVFVFTCKDIMASKCRERVILSEDFALKPGDFVVVDNFPIHHGRAEQIFSLFLYQLWNRIHLYPCLQCTQFEPSRALFPTHEKFV